MAAVELTRRQWLWATLLAGCAKKPSLPVGLSGGICGPSDLRGHAIRDGGKNKGEAQPTFTWSTEVAILGGGVSGLSAAWTLRRAGFEDFLLLELEDEAGGTSRPGHSPVSPHPWGAHYLPVPTQEQKATCALLSELGVLQGFDAAGRAQCAEEALCRAPQERIFYKGRWYEGLYLRAGASAEDLRQFDRFHEEVGNWVSARGQDGRRAFTLPQCQGDRSVGAVLDGLSFADWLRQRGLVSSRLRFYTDYACRDDFGVPLGETSAWAGIHYFAARLQKPTDRSPEVLTWPEGNGWLVQRLARPLGDRLRTGCVVLDVRPLPEGGVEVRFLRHPPSAAGQPTGGPVLGALRARHVVFALPTFLRPHLIAPLRAAFASGPIPGHSFLRQFQYTPWLVANLTLRRAASPPVAFGPAAMLGPKQMPGYPLCWDNVLVESPSLGYVVATHQREPAPPADGIPRTVYTYYLPLGSEPPVAARERLFKTPWSTWCRTILDDLGRADPDLEQRVERIDIFRFGHAMVRPTPGLFSGPALAQAALPMGPIHFAHTDLAGMALFEEAQHAGVRAAQAILDERGQKYEAL